MQNIFAQHCVLLCRVQPQHCLECDNEQVFG